MADYNVTARFEADAAGYISAVNQAKAATEGLGDAADKAGQQTSKAFTGSGQGLKQASDSATKATSSIKNVGDAAGHTGKHAKSAFDGIANGVQAANISLDGAAGKYTNLGDRASVAMQKATQGIRDHSSEIKTAGTAVTAVGGVWAGLNTAMAATGIQYNTLQQVSSKAMETMTGSAEAAAIQMERFHAFADESPFSRATFLEAQQQLMAFGMEAERVVPSLEGIENAVAAIGGGNAEIMQLTDILGAIQGQGKITGRELQRMGQMGIDAADIIGEQMGKSGAAIREEITAGTLDADTAIEALTTGMSQRFEGAAAGLKDTFEGALDRVKAAFRDLSGDMFEWAVGSDGGGFLTYALNGVADFIRVIEQLPGPVKNALGIISTLGSTATVAAGGFMILAPQAVQAWDAFVKLSNATGATTLLENIRQRAPQAGAALSGIGKFAGIAAVSMAAMKAVGELVTTQQVYSVEALHDAVEALGETASSASIDRFFNDWATVDLPGTRNSTDDINDLESAMARLAEPRTGSEKFNMWADKAFAWTGAAQSDLTQIEQKVIDTGEALAGMVNAGDVEQASAAFNVLADSFTANGGQVSDLIDLMPNYIESLVNAAGAAGVTITESEALEWALSGVAPAAVDAAGGLDDMGGAAESLDNSLEGVIGKLQQMGLLALSERDALRGFEESLLDAGEAADEYGKVLDKNGDLQSKYMEEGIKAQEELDGIAESTRALLEAQIENGASQEDLTATYERGKQAYIDTAEAMGMGETEAKALADALFAIPDKHGTTIEIDAFGLEVAEALAREIEELPEHKFVDVAVQEDGSFTSIQEGLDDMGEPILVSVDAEGNATEVTESIREIDGELVTVLVDDDGSVMQLRGDIEGEVSTLPVEAEMPDGEEIVRNMFEGFKARLEVDADTAQAESDVQSLADMEVTGSVTIVVSDNGTQAEVQQRINSTTGKTETVVVTDDGTVARVQQQIIDVNGVERTVWVDDNGTVYGTQAAIDGVRDGSANISVTSSGIGAVEAALNNAARNRTATISVVTSAPTQARPSYVLGATGGATGGVVGRDFGLAAGGIAGGLATAGLPKLATGGRLPYTGLGTDMILGHNAQGVPTAWVDDGEWVVREQMSRKYHHAIGLINQDHPSVQYLAGLAGGGQAGRERLAASVPYFPPVHLTAPAPQSGPVNLSAGSIQALARAVQPYLVVQDQVIAQANGADAKQGTLAGRF